MGPHPAENRIVFHWFEMCDAVQTESYFVDDVAVSNFVLPLYFTGTREIDEPGARNDFLGRASAGRTLHSFGVNPGGYVGFFDPETGQHETFSASNDERAQLRLRAKSAALEARRSTRYRLFGSASRVRPSLVSRKARAQARVPLTPIVLRTSVQRSANVRRVRIDTKGGRRAAPRAASKPRRAERTRS